jgi:hypothetical protein
MADSQTQFAQEKMRYLLSQGVDPQRAAAMVGNAWHESSLNPGILGDKGDSYGLYQFNKGGELPAYKDWASKNNRDLGDWKAQTDFVLSRLQSPAYASTWTKMGEAKDLSGATEAFMRGYERPKESAAALDNRIELAKKASGLTYEGAAPSPVGYAQLQPGMTGLLGATMPQQAGGPAQMASMSMLPQTNQMSFASVPQGLLDPNKPQAQMAQIQPQAPVGGDFDFSKLAGAGLGLMASGAPKSSAPAPQMGQIHRPQANPNLFAGLLRKPWDV